jgi:hypothetical protein
MSSHYVKPLPAIDAVNRPYWEAAKRHEFVLQQCVACGRYRYPAGLVCPTCLSDKLDWVKATGRGRIFTWTVIHQLYHPAFAADVPYAVVAVELEEGPRMNANLIGCKPGDITVGMPVEVTFEDVTEEVTLPKFKPR